MTKLTPYSIGVRCLPQSTLPHFSMENEGTSQHSHDIDQDGHLEKNPPHPLWKFFVRGSGIIILSILAGTGYRIHKKIEERQNTRYIPMQSNFIPVQMSYREHFIDILLGKYDLPVKVKSMPALSDTRAKMWKEKGREYTKIYGETAGVFLLFRSEYTPPEKSAPPVMSSAKFWRDAPDGEMKLSLSTGNISVYAHFRNGVWEVRGIYGILECDGENRKLELNDMSRNQRGLQMLTEEEGEALLARTNFYKVFPSVVESAEGGQNERIIIPTDVKYALYSLVDREFRTLNSEKE